MDEIATNDHAGLAWDRVIAAVRREIDDRRLHPAQVVVLLPYVQLIGVARGAWMRSAGANPDGAYFMPRFETTMNWSRTVAGFVPEPDDLVRDPARDLLTAAVLLERSGQTQTPSALAARLMETAWSVAPLAAAQPPDGRVAWGARMVQTMQDLGAPPLLEWESRLGRIAIVWAAHSAYATDALFSAQAELLVSIAGLQHDPMHAALCQRWGARAVTLALASLRDPGPCLLRQALDAEDEAELASAVVLDHLAAGRMPLALVAHDRVLTRRARAMLAERGVAVRDETGWTLSTTRAAAAIVALLRALASDATSDMVLDWAKQLPALDSDDVERLEAQVRRSGTREWHAVAVQSDSRVRIEAWRSGMQLPRDLGDWLRSLRAALQDTGQWTGLLQDTAGQAVIDALHLHEHADGGFADATQRIGLSGFASWVSQVLEAGSFVPPHPAQAQVVILPLSQLLGRSMAAVVMPGCDEGNLPASPELPGAWTSAQRAVLGLPSREELAGTLAVSWRNALAMPHVDILWRASDAGEMRMPSVLVQQLRLTHAALAPDPRVIRSLHTRPSHMPAPTAPALGVQRLSASAYEDLRRCPYRFFALRMLGLQESDELDTALGKRDFGNWLHAVLRHFHEALLHAPTGAAPQESAGAPPGSLAAAGGVRGSQGWRHSDKADLLDRAARQASADLAMAANEFLPFAAVWPQVRAAYLAWLADHEASGARFVVAEAQREMPLARWTLIGRIDRIDRLDDGSTLVIDYKTEARATTTQRVRHPEEDSQLAFYAALLEDDPVAAMYLNIAESDTTQAFVLPDAPQWRDRLVEGIVSDLGRIAQGAPLPAIGAGASCDFCAARGVCRKDFWTPAPPARTEAGHA